MIVAMGENRVIGSEGKMLWHLPTDFRRFKDLTMGHPIIMGRKTFESIGKPLPGRKNIVVTRNKDFHAEGIFTAPSLSEAFRLADRMNPDDANDIFVIGGAEIYGMALSHAKRLYVTNVHGAFKGDTFFPEILAEDWTLTSSEPHQKDEKNDFDFDFLIYDKKGSTIG
jgi:dihydrofolate reductase